ncbi:hypothetical protein [Fibrella forsythiae]|uniref:ABC transporter permease n=1 Tax=Fibrella forsythiae TaxID=2817061 RepID=A0ABS3JDF7_9BACT|nr:hypothetical protein [Fibrella forsythiae]MBO0948034.1 hypothetical protein [Fibrella forsythiae]
MNQTFSLTRFARLNRWFWATKRRTYLIAALALIPIIMLVPSQVLSNDHIFQLGVQRNNILYYNFLALLVTFSIGSDVFSALFRQESAISYLMIPASRTEKFWLGALYCIVALLLLSIAYFGYEAIVFNIANSRLLPTETDRYVSTLIFNYTSIYGDKDFLLLIPYFLFTSLAISLIGSFFFRRGVFIRNVGSVLILTIGLLFLYRWIVGMVSGEGVGTALPFYQIAVHTSKSNYELLGPPDWLKHSAYAGMLLAFWVIARVRFNEIER